MKISEVILAGIILLVLIIPGLVIVIGLTVAALVFPFIMVIIWFIAAILDLVTLPLHAVGWLTGIGCHIFILTETIEKIPGVRDMMYVTPYRAVKRG